MLLVDPAGTFGLVVLSTDVESEPVKRIRVTGADEVPLGVYAVRAGLGVGNRALVPPVAERDLTVVVLDAVGVGVNVTGLDRDGLVVDLDPQVDPTFGARGVGCDCRGHSGP